MYPDKVKNQGKQLVVDTGTIEDVRPSFQTVVCTADKELCRLASMNIWIYGSMANSTLGTMN